MTIDREHPLRAMLDMAAVGNVPTPDDLDACGLTTARARQAALNAALDCVALRQSGEHARARSLARSTAQELSDRLLPPQPSPEANVVDPDELARIITDHR